jgi:signal peptidase
MKTSKKMPLKILQYAMLVLFAFLVSICLSIMIQMKIHPDRVPSIFGYKPFVVLSGSMEAEIAKGDLAITKEIDADTLQKNDVVAFWDKQGHVVTHRIVDIVEKNGENSPNRLANGKKYVIMVLQVMFLPRNL